MSPLAELLVIVAPGCSGSFYTAIYSEDGVEQTCLYKHIEVMDNWVFKWP